MRSGDRRYFFDTVSLSNFALAGRLDVLISRYPSRVMVTQEVLDEVTDGVVAGYAELREIETAVADTLLRNVGSPSSAEERSLYRQLLRTLSPGEASCITMP